MKKILIPTIMILAVILLVGCDGIIPGGTGELTYAQVQQYAQQTLTAQAAPADDNYGGLLIRPVIPTSADTTSGLTVVSTPETENLITRPVYNIPTAVPTAVPTAIPTAIPTAASYVPLVNVPTVSYSTPNYAQQVNTVCDRIRFIDDVTIPDDTVMQPGQVFRKTWRIQNAGSCVWTAGYQLIFYSGDRMGDVYAANLPGVVAPGETVDVSVDLTAPRAYGEFQGNWKLRSPSGNVFGTANSTNDAIWVKIVVGSNANMATVAPGVTPVNSGCTLLSVVPAYRTVFGPGEETDFEFRVRNDSVINWDAKDIDIAYIGGENLLKRKTNTRMDLPMDVAPGGSLYYALDAVVPTTPGVYTMTMGIVRGYEVLCSMDVTVTVQY